MLPDPMSPLWNETREVLRNQVGEAFFTTHFEQLVERSGPDGSLVLATADEMTALVVEKNYRDLIARCAETVAGSSLDVRIQWDPSLAAFVEPAVATAPRTPHEARQVGLFPSPHDPRAEAAHPIAALQARLPARGTPEPPSPAARASACGLQANASFESFVVGSSNAFAYEAARAVAQHPGQLHNPLFIYGGVGLGKTHLMNAIGLAFLERRPNATVRYLSAETFTNELINSLMTKQVDAFRQRTRHEVDLLLIDDIQFIAGKERTQEEFFHTFNTLHQAGRQIVLTSDRFPQEMPELEERLKSRLTMGLITDIQPPELETRIAILRTRAQAQRFDLPDDVLDFIARHIRSNVRDLHGALHRIGTWGRLQRKTITLDDARQQLAPLLRDFEARITPDILLRTTAETYGVPVRELTGRRRTARVALPRKVAMFLAKKHTDASYPELGRFFGGRDHTTVLSACRSIEDALTSDAELRQRIDSIERRLNLR